MNALAHEARLALIALQFFTRLPMPSWLGHSPELLGASARHLPFVGLIVGGIVSCVFWSARVVLPHAVAIVISMAAGVWITGGFHEDGLADSCDGFGGGADREAVLRIMKDSRAGSYAILGVGLALLLKFASLESFAPGKFMPVVISAHAFSRLMAVSVMYTQSYARDEATSKIRPAAVRITGWALAGAAAVAIAPMPWLGMAALPGAVAALAGCVALAWSFRRRIGGYTGDSLGAIQQVTELIFYLGVLTWNSRGTAAGI